jgi:hypothetical protein
MFVDVEGNLWDLKKFLEISREFVRKWNFNFLNDGNFSCLCGPCSVKFTQAPGILDAVK